MVEKKLIQSNFRIQDRRGRTIFQPKKRKCIGCDKFINEKNELREIESTSEKVISEETAYQMTSILQGAVQRAAKELRSLNVPHIWEEKQVLLIITLMPGSWVFV